MVQPDRREWARDVARALDRLDADHRQALTLVYVDHFTQQQVASRMGVAASLVASRVSAALRTLANVTLIESQPEPTGP